MREFWIIKEPPFSTWVSDKPLNSGDTSEEIHVIEYEAFKELLERYNALETKFKIYEGLAVKPNRMILEFDKE